MRTTSIKLAVFVTVIAAACEIPTETAVNQCPPPQGELGAQACAIIEGTAVSPDGDPIPSLILRVDSMVDGRPAYLSQLQTTNANGRFRMKVLRMFAPPSPGERELDSVAITASPAESGQDLTPSVTSELLLVEFARMGEMTDIRDVEVTVDMP